MAQIWARTMRQRALVGLKGKGFAALSFSSTTSASSSSLPRLTLYTHDSCSLCDEALEQIAHLKTRFTLETVDILHPDNQSWKRQYRYDIPVFHFEGEFLTKHRADVKMLEDKLTAFEARQ